MPFMYCDPPAAITQIRPAADQTHAGSGRVTLANGATFEISLPGSGPDSDFLGKLKKTDPIQICYAPAQRWADEPANARMAIVGDLATSAYMYGVAVPAPTK